MIKDKNHLPTSYSYSPHPTPHTPHPIPSVLPDPTDSTTIAYLRSPQAIRERCGQLFDLACANKLQYFQCDLSQLDRVADYVIQITRENYPDLAIPFHSRWRHFEVGGRSRLEALEKKLAELSPLEQAQAKFDLAIISVLLDAGAGSVWRFQEPGTEQIFRRSEGLAVASFHLFCEGMFSSDPTHPLQVDAIALQQITAASLSKGLQVSSTNPLVGVSGRVKLLNQLGQTLPLYPQLFGSDPPRPGYLVNYLLEQATNHHLAAPKVLSSVLTGFSNIWPGRITLSGINLGDVWHYPALSLSPPPPPTPHSSPSTNSPNGSPTRFWSHYRSLD
ncbi:DUF1688 family protein [Kovacikia minuta]|uniref:DUF1688 family protein n=1 Tax=Kovacikia minuta TaxID=2931930 RepID=UPI0020C7EF3D